MEEEIKLARSVRVNMPEVRNVKVNECDGKTEIYEWVNENRERFTSYRFLIGFVNDNEIVTPFKPLDGQSNDVYLYSATDIGNNLFTTIDDAVASYGVSLLDIVVYDLKNGDLWYVESKKSYADVGLTKTHM